LPGEFYCTYEFMQQILTLKKKFFFNNGVYRQQIEQFPEFTIKKLVEMIKDNETVLSYLPDIKLDNPRQV
jgi:hypothetical protein